MKKHITLAIFALMAAQNTRTMEKAIIDGNFEYVRNNLAILTSESKEVYLEIANKQANLAISQSNSIKPNNWDLASLGAATILGWSVIKDAKNFLYLGEEIADCNNTITKLCDKAAFFKLKANPEISQKFISSNLQEDKNIKKNYQEIYESIFRGLFHDFKNNPKYFYSLETPQGNLRRSLVELPLTKVYAKIISISAKTLLTIWLLNRAYGSHYKNLDYKNRLAIKQLVENAPINDTNSSLLESSKTFKEQLTYTLDSVKIMGSDLKNDATQVLNKIKEKFEQYRNTKQ